MAHEGDPFRGVVLQYLMNSPLLITALTLTQTDERLKKLLRHNS